MCCVELNINEVMDVRDNNSSNILYTLISKGGEYITRITKTKTDKNIVLSHWNNKSVDI